MTYLGRGPKFKYVSHIRCMYSLQVIYTVFGTIWNPSYEVKYKIFHLWGHVNTQKISYFEPSGFQTFGLGCSTYIYKGTMIWSSRKYKPYGMYEGTGPLWYGWNKGEMVDETRKKIRASQWYGGYSGWNPTAQVWVSDWRFEKYTGATCVHGQNPDRKLKEELQHGHPLGEVISHVLSVSREHTCSTAKTKTKQNSINIQGWDSEGLYVLKLKTGNLTQNIMWNN